MVDLYGLLPETERIIVDVLRQLIIDHLPAYFYGKKGICIVWPATIPRGGIKSGVLLGFWYGNRLKDVDNYLTHGTNKQVFYKIYKSPREINTKAIVKLLKEAVLQDDLW